MMKYCDCIEQFNKEMEGTEHLSPFTEVFLLFESPPVIIYAICVPQRTPKGNVSQRKTTNIIMRHCPFCGKKLPLAQKADGGNGR